MWMTKSNFEKLSQFEGILKNVKNKTVFLNVFKNSAKNMVKNVESVEKLLQR